MQPGQLLVDTNVLISVYQREKNRKTVQKTCYEMLLSYGCLTSIPSVILEFLPHIQDVDKDGRLLSVKGHRRRLDAFIEDIKTTLPFAVINDAESWLAVEISRKCKENGHELSTSKQADIFLASIALNRGWEILTEETADYNRMVESGFNVPLFDAKSFLEIV